MSGSLSVALPGQVWDLAAPDAGGPILTTGYDGKNFSTTVLTALDLNGQTLWRRTFDGHSGLPSEPRISGDGTVWIAHEGARGTMLTGLDPTGAILDEVVLEHEEFEQLGAFVMLRDGICASWLPAKGRRVAAPDQHARVARHAPDGARHWSTPAVLDQLSYPGVLEMSVETRWQVRPSKPWTPRTVEADHWEPLLVAGHRIAATFADGHSGIAVTFFLDTDTGRLLAASPPAPGGHKAIAGPGQFLIGSQGYGAFCTARHDASGAVVQQWSTHALLLIDRNGAISGPESENRLPSRSRFAALEPDDTVRRGAALDGYHTSYPALDEHGTAVFWRHGRLQAVDPDLTRRELLEIGDAKRGYSARMLLLDNGLLAFTLEGELILTRQQSLGALDTGVWPCRDGGLHGNPVLYE